MGNASTASKYRQYLEDAPYSAEQEVHAIKQFILRLKYYAHWRLVCSFEYSIKVVWLLCI